MTYSYSSSSTWTCNRCGKTIGSGEVRNGLCRSCQIETWDIEHFGKRD